MYLVMIVQKFLSADLKNRWAICVEIEVMISFTSSEMTLMNWSFNIDACLSSYCNQCYFSSTHLHHLLLI